tara:strand:- start:438 stop:1289 length:852 start_codon:yes stop_codon:yes gene_type:complete
MNILFTGCTSYIGKYLILKFLENRKHKLIGISRSDPKINHKRFRWFKHDLTYLPFNKIKNIDIIIHIAGAALRKENSFNDYVQGNIFMAYNLSKTSNYCKPKMIIYASTREVYGEINSKILTEKNNILNPIFYGQTKYLAEQILSASCKTISLRLPAVLGKGTHGWISKVYKKMMNNEKIKFLNSKFNNFIYVDDIYGIIDNFINKRIFIDDHFNVSCSSVTTSEKLLIFMKNYLNSKSKIIKEKKKNHSYTISSKKLSKYYKTKSVNETIIHFLKEQNNNKQ